MTAMRITGRARKFGDDINTDYIISSLRKKATLEPHELKTFLFEAIDPTFAESVQPDDLVVAGKNFGCGSAMEVAVTVMRASGIQAVLAKSFARTYYRNAINNGLVPIECDTENIREGDRMTVVIDGGGVSVRNDDSETTAVGRALAGVPMEILTAGGIVPYLREHGGFGPS